MSLSLSSLSLKLSSNGLVEGGWEATARLLICAAIDAMLSLLVATLKGESLLMRAVSRMLTDSKVTLERRKRIGSGSVRLEVGWPWTMK